MSDAVRILVAEDEPQIQRFVEEALSDCGFEADIAQSGEGALPRFNDGRPGYKALVTDINLGFVHRLAFRHAGRHQRPASRLDAG